MTAHLLFVGYPQVVWRIIGVRWHCSAAWIRLSWLTGTVVFETFVLNRLVAGLSWHEIARTYDLLAGEY